MLAGLAFCYLCGQAKTGDEQCCRNTFHCGASSQNKCGLISASLTLLSPKGSVYRGGKDAKEQTVGHARRKRGLNSAVPKQRNDARRQALLLPEQHKIQGTPQRREAGHGRLPPAAHDLQCASRARPRGGHDLPRAAGPSNAASLAWLARALPHPGALITPALPRPNFRLKRACGSENARVHFRAHTTWFSGRKQKDGNFSVLV